MITPIKPKSQNCFFCFLFCFFHGQASVEREFNDSDIVEHVNISPETTIAKKKIINFFRVHEIKPEVMKVSQEMIESVKYSHREYLADLESKTAEKVKTDVENRRLAITEDLKMLERRWKKQLKTWKRRLMIVYQES